MRIKKKVSFFGNDGANRGFAARSGSVAGKISVAVERIREAVRIFKPSHVFALYSGGGDSRTVVEAACRVKEFSGCVHCNTGIGIEETRDFVRQTCKTKGWNLLEYKAAENTKADGTPDPQNYDDLVRRYGFPGPAQHFRMYVRLKERGIARLMRAHKQHPRDRILLLSGARKSESVRRMGNTMEIERRGCQVWANPILDWETSDIRSLFEQEKIKRNPVNECLGMSGECLCGAFARPGELDTVASYFPYIGQRIDALHAETKSKFPWRWDEEPPEPPKHEKALRKILKAGQSVMPFMPMCWNCNKRETVLPATAGRTPVADSNGS